MQRAMMSSAFALLLCLVPQIGRSQPSVLLHSAVTVSPDKGVHGPVRHGEPVQGAFSITNVSSGSLVLASVKKSCSNCTELNYTTGTLDRGATTTVSYRIDTNKASPPLYQVGIYYNIVVNGVAQSGLYPITCQISPEEKVSPERIDIGDVSPEQFPLDTKVTVTDVGNDPITSLTATCSAPFVQIGNTRKTGDVYEIPLRIVQPSDGTTDLSTTIRAREGKREHLVPIVGRVLGPITLAADKIILGPLGGAKSTTAYLSLLKRDDVTLLEIVPSTPKITARIERLETSTGIRLNLVAKFASDGTSLADKKMERSEIRISYTVGQSPGKETLVCPVVVVY